MALVGPARPPTTLPACRYARHRTAAIIFMLIQAYLWLSLSHVSFYEGLVPGTGKGQGEWICGGMGCCFSALLQL